MQRPPLVNISLQSLKNMSSEPPRIQHEIYLASDWLRGFPKNLWHRTTNRMSGREGCKAPEAHLPLHPPMSCDLLYPKWEAINKDSNFASLPSAQYVRSHKSLAPRPRALREWCMVTFVQSPTYNFTRSREPSLGPLQPAKPWLGASIYLIYDPYHIQEPRDGPRCYPEPCTLIQRA